MYASVIIAYAFIIRSPVVFTGIMLNILQYAAKTATMCKNV